MGLGKSVYEVWLQEMHPSDPSFEAFLRTIQGVQGASGKSGNGGGCCGCGCGDDCDVSDTIVQLVPPNKTVSLDFSEVLFEYWNDNILLYFDIDMPSGVFTYDDDTHILTFINGDASIKVISIAYSYFKSGNYLLVSPTVFVPSSSIESNNE